MDDTERVSELSSDAIGGMTEEIASHLYPFLDHDDDAVVRRAFGAFEYGPRDDTERNRIQYDRVVEAASRVLRDEPEPAVAQRIYDTLSFVVGEHAPHAVESFDERDREWALELLDHEIYVYRELGCRILAAIGEPADVDRLDEVAATDDSDDVREAARAAIDSIE